MTALAFTAAPLVRPPGAPDDTPARPGPGVRGLAAPSSLRRRRSERRSYLFRRESAPFEEAGLTSPLGPVGGRRIAETPGPRLRRLFGPERVVPSDRLPGRRAVDPAPAKLLVDAPGTVAAAEARADVLLGEPLLAQQPLRFERIEHAFDRIRPGAARGELERELAARVLTPRE